MLVTGTLHPGGTEKQAYYTVVSLRKQGVEVKLVSLEPNGYWQRRIENELGLEVELVPPMHPVLRLIRLERVARAFRPEVVHTFHFYAGTYMVLLRPWLRAPVIVSMRTSLRLLRQRSRRWERMLTFSRADRIAANSWAGIRELKKSIWRPVLEKTVYLPNTIDVGTLPPPLSYRPGDPFVLMFAGNISHAKNVPLLLDVVKNLRDNGYRVKAVIIGDGQTLGSVISYAERLGISEIVEFHGRVPNVRAMLRKAHAFFFPSMLEGMPNVVMEAVSEGVPVISSRVGDVPQLIKDGQSGFLFEVDNVVEAYEKTRRLIETYSEQAPLLTASAFRRLKAHYAFEHYPQRLAALYESTLRR